MVNYVLWEYSIMCNLSFIYNGFKISMFPAWHVLNSGAEARTMLLIKIFNININYSLNFFF